jgi:N-formylglutamate amidohydrolase
MGQDELERRLDDAYRPYHRAIEEQLSRILDRFGCALLLDCHSMPPSKNSASVVFGDRFGRAAAPWLMSKAMSVTSSTGLAAAANVPFAGGQIVVRHGRPDVGVLAIQVEIDRSL